MYETSFDRSSSDGPPVEPFTARAITESIAPFAPGIFVTASPASETACRPRDIEPNQPR